MTIETRSTIGIGDITAIEYECLHCHCKTIRLLDDKHNVPLRCGNCSSNWFADGSREHREICRLLDVLRNFPESSVKTQVAVKFEIRELPKTSAWAPASSEKD